MQQATLGCARFSPDVSYNAGSYPPSRTPLKIAFPCGEGSFALPLPAPHSRFPVPPSPTPPGKTFFRRARERFGDVRTGVSIGAFRISLVKPVAIPPSPRSPRLAILLHKRERADGAVREDEHPEFTLVRVFFSRSCGNTMCALRVSFGPFATSSPRATPPPLLVPVFFYLLLKFFSVLSEFVDTRVNRLPVGVYLCCHARRVHFEARGGEQNRKLGRA